MHLHTLVTAVEKNKVNDSVLLAIHDVSEQDFQQPELYPADECSNIKH